MREESKEFSQTTLPFFSYFMSALLENKNFIILYKILKTRGKILQGKIKFVGRK